MNDLTILRYLLLVPGFPVMAIGFLWGVLEPFFETGRKAGNDAFVEIEEGDE
jgi:hypothetical protein